MSPVDAELLERLLTDTAFRDRFRRDPAAAAREAGHPELGDRLAADGTRALERLELRESRSSVGGMMLAAAVEGLGLLEIADQCEDAQAAAPLGDQVATAQDEPAATVPDDEAPPVPDDEDEPDEDEPDEDEPDEDDVEERETADTGEEGASADTDVSRDPGDAESDASDGDDESGRPGDEGEPPHPVPSPDAEWRPDPEQYGMAGGGGPPSPIDAAVLHNPRITLDADGRRDFAAGRMDPRVGELVLRLAEKHRITLSATSSDHPQNTTGGSPSNHWYGRAVDIATVDGDIVRADSAAGRRLAASLVRLDASIRPSEVGSPWSLSAPGFFTDPDHQDHIHVAFDDPVSASWRPRSETRVMPAITPDER